jgi:hypothetical protein
VTVPILLLVLGLALLVADILAYDVVMHRWLNRNGGTQHILKWLECRERSIARIPMGALYLRLRNKPASKASQPEAREHE